MSETVPISSLCASVCVRSIYIDHREWLVGVGATSYFVLVSLGLVPGIITRGVITPGAS